MVNIGYTSIEIKRTQKVSNPEELDSQFYALVACQLYLPYLRVSREGSSPGESSYIPEDHKSAPYSDLGHLDKKQHVHKVRNINVINDMK